MLADDRNITTLDSVHKEKQAEFNYIKTMLIPKLKEEKCVIKNQLKDVDLPLEVMLEKKDRLIELAGLIRHHNAIIKTYYLNNNKYIFSYFETKKEISSQPAATAVSGKTETSSQLAHSNTVLSTDPSSTSMISPSSKTQIINAFFKVNNNRDGGGGGGGGGGGSGSSGSSGSSGTVSLPGSTTDVSTSHALGVPSAPPTTTKQELYKLNCTNVQQYLHNIDHSYINLDRYTYRTDICAQCKQGEMVPIDSEGILVCNKCSSFIVYFVENEKPSYKEPPKEACFYAYKRINHFREIIAQFQAKETTQIDRSIIDAIEHQIRKERITLDQFTDTKAKEILKKLGYNKYYEHIPFIKDKLGIKPPVMSHELEETLCNLFMEIQGPYARFCPDERVNFLNYYYTIYKLCELLGQTQFLSFFPMLKDRDKRIEQDEIWKNICKELKWIFIPTQ